MADLLFAVGIILQCKEYLKDKDDRTAKHLMGLIEDFINRTDNKTTDTKQPEQE